MTGDRRSGPIFSETFANGSGEAFWLVIVPENALPGPCIGARLAAVESRFRGSSRSPEAGDRVRMRVICAHSVRTANKAGIMAAHTRTGDCLPETAKLLSKSTSREEDSGSSGSRTPGLRAILRLIRSSRSTPTTRSSTTGSTHFGKDNHGRTTITTCRFLIDLARGRFSRRDALKASGALAAGAAIGGGLTIRQLADVSAQSPEAGAAPSGEVVWALDSSAA